MSSTKRVVALEEEEEESQAQESSSKTVPEFHFAKLRLENAMEKGKPMNLVQREELLPHTSGSFDMSSTKRVVALEEEEEEEESQAQESSSKTVPDFHFTKLRLENAMEKGEPMNLVQREELLPHTSGSYDMSSTTRVVALEEEEEESKAQEPSPKAIPDFHFARLRLDTSGSFDMSSHKCVVALEEEEEESKTQEPSSKAIPEIQYSRLRLGNAMERGEPTNLVQREELLLHTSGSFDMSSTTRVVAQEEEEEESKTQEPSSKAIPDFHFARLRLGNAMERGEPVNLVQRKEFLLHTSGSSDMSSTKRDVESRHVISYRSIERQPTSSCWVTCILLIEIIDQKGIIRYQGAV
jgi:hypothetical protein